jgi:hypothetical protein
MNIFEREAMERDESLQLQGILSAWGSFKTAVLQLIDSYKTLIPEGQHYGAAVEEPDERSIVIICPRGPSPKARLSSLAITIRAGMVSQDRFAIDCRIEQWRKALVASAAPCTEWKKSMIFVLDGDHTSLMFANEKFTPAQAANKLLETLLIRK